MSKNIFFEVLSKDELKALINDAVKDGIKEQITQKEYSNSDFELLTREEACKFLKIDPSTLWSWTKKGKVNALGIGYRRYYNKQELINNLKIVKQ